VAKIGRRLANFLVDGQTATDEIAEPKKKLVGFASIRAGDKELKQQYTELNGFVAATLRGT
jgi:hypothetical protein